MFSPVSVRIDHAEQGLDLAALFFRELGAPHIENQHQTVVIAIVSCFVFDAVIKHHQFAKVPFTRSGTHADTALIGHHQRKVADQTAVDHAEMCR